MIRRCNNAVLFHVKGKYPSAGSHLLRQAEMGCGGTRAAVAKRLLNLPAERAA